MKTSLLVAAVAIATLAGAVDSQEQKQLTHSPPAASASISATNLYDTVWRSQNLGTGFVRYVVLKSDGSVGYSETSSNFKYDGTDTWKLEKGVLLITWSNGFAKEQYAIDTTTGTVFDGEKTSTKWEDKQRVRLSKVGDKQSGM